MRKDGYTLIELAIVVFLVGLMLTLAVPKIRESLLSDGLKSTTRHLIGAVRELRGDAVREQLDYVIHFDLKNNAYWTYSVDMTPEKRDEQKSRSFRFPEGVKIVDISQIGREKKMDGEVDVKIFKQGYVQPTVIHLNNDDRNYTLVISPFLNSIKVYEKYAEVGADGRETE